MKHIVVSRLDNLGDVVMTTPILYGLKRLYPEAKLSFIVHENLTAAVDRVPFIDEIIPFPKERTFANQYNIYKKIAHADMIYLVDYTHRISLLAYLARIKERIGIAHKRGKYLTTPVKWDKSMDAIYDPQLFADILKEKLNINIMDEDNWCDFHYSKASDAEKNHINEILSEHNFDIKNPYINFSLYTGERAKNWSEENWQALWKRIKDISNIKIVLTGDNSKNIKFSDNVIDLAGKTNLYELGYVIENARLVINGCSGPMHIAKAFHTPTIGLYGPTPVAKGAPPNNYASIVTSAVCAPCNGDYSTPCDTPFCMDMISVDEVYDVVARFLKENNLLG